MLFNSFSFLFFFPAVVFTYYTIPFRFRSSLLLAASVFFYMSFVPAYVLILLLLIVVDYVAGRFIERRKGTSRVIFLCVSILTNVGILFFFKYFNFFNINLSALADFMHWNYSPSLLAIALPLGLSFHVFQSLSYIIEVYKGKYAAERNFFVYALYVMFFPQLVAGPIERPAHLLPQLKLEHKFNAGNVRMGLERMLWGFYKKLVIADQIAIIVDHMYGNLPTDGPALVLLILLFAYQLYCDFSGYSDIAVGSARVLGFELTENFNRPYAARSLAEFWRRWHISLSGWFRDYVYYPLVLGWGKVSKLKLYVGIFVTFVLIGLWHGANWTFVVMGAMHGAYLSISSATEKLRTRIAGMSKAFQIPNIAARLFQTAFVFSFVSVSWIFFRSSSVAEAWQILSHLGNNFSFDYIQHSLFTLPTLGVGNTRLLVILFAVILMELFQHFQERLGTFYLFDGKPKLVRYGWYYALAFAILFFGYFGEQPFIYFKF